MSPLPQRTRRKRSKSKSHGTTAHTGERFRVNTRHGDASEGVFLEACSKHPQMLIFSTFLHSIDSGMHPRAAGDMRMSSPPAPMLVETASPFPNSGKASKMFCATCCCRRLPLLLHDWGRMVVYVCYVLFPNSNAQKGPHTLPNNAEFQNHRGETAVTQF